MSVEAEVKEQCCAWTQQGSSREMLGEGSWGLGELLSPKSTFKEWGKGIQMRTVKSKNCFQELEPTATEWGLSGHGLKWGGSQSCFLELGTWGVTRLCRPCRGMGDRDEADGCCPACHMRTAGAERCPPGQKHCWERREKVLPTWVLRRGVWSKPKQGAGEGDRLVGTTNHGLRVRRQEWWGRRAILYVS